MTNRSSVLSRRLIRLQSIAIIMIGRLLVGDARSSLLQATHEIAMDVSRYLLRSDEVAYVCIPHNTTLAFILPSDQPTRPRSCPSSAPLAWQESYAGFMETIAAARDLGSWAAPTTRPGHEHDKENAHAATATATAVPYGGNNALPVPRYRPLVELPNGHGGRLHNPLYPTPPAATRNPPAACSPALASATTAAVWRGNRLGSGGGGKDAVRVGGPSPSSRRPGHYYQRSASDAGSATCRGGGYAAEVVVAARRPRSGVGAGGGGAGGGRRRGAVGLVTSSAADEMHLAAVATGRAGRKRLSSRV